MEQVDPKSTKKYLENQVQRNKNNIIDLRIDYDELTEWVSQIHHKLDNHIREHDKLIEKLKKKILLSKKQSFFGKRRDAISVLLGAAVLFTLLVLSGLKICGII